MTLKDLLHDCNAVTAPKIQIRYYDDPSGDEVVLLEQDTDLRLCYRLKSYLDLDIRYLEVMTNTLIIEVDTPKPSVFLVYDLIQDSFVGPIKVFSNEQDAIAFLRMEADKQFDECDIPKESRVLNDYVAYDEDQEYVNLYIEEEVLN